MPLAYNHSLTLSQIFLKGLKSGEQDHCRSWSLWNANILKCSMSVILGWLGELSCLNSTFRLNVNVFFKTHVWRLIFKKSMQSSKTCRHVLRIRHTGIQTENDIYAWQCAMSCYCNEFDNYWLPYNCGLVPYSAQLDRHLFHDISSWNGS